MNKLVKIFSPMLLAVLIVSCSDPFPNAVTEAYTFINNSSFSLDIFDTSVKSNDFDTFTLESGETRSVNITDDRYTDCDYCFTNNDLVTSCMFGNTITFRDIP